MAKYTGHTITSDSALGSAVIKRSLRIDQGASDLTGSNYSRTFGSGNRKTYTISVWVKKCNTPGNIGDGDDQYSMFSAGGGGSGAAQGNFFFYNDDTLRFQSNPQPSTVLKLITNRKFRDDTSWYHLMAVLDTTQATESNRAKIYVNGVQETSFSTATYPSQNNTTVYFNGAFRHRVGSNSLGSDLTASYGNFNGYLAEYNFVDGQALEPSSFGFTDPQTGIWMPKRYEGTYGTNGFYLDFTDNTSTTTLGIDKSPNGNDFTPEDASTGDRVLDTPSNNFSTLRHHLEPAASGASLAEGNLKHTSGSSGSARNLNRMGISTLLPTSGKWYAEVKLLTNTNQTAIGVGPYQVELLPTVNNSRYVFIYGDDGNKYVNTNGSESNATYGSSYTQNDIIGIYVDMDASTPLVSFSKNGQWANGSGSWNQSTPTSYITLGDTFFTESTGGHLGIGFIVHSGSGPTSVSYQANFGQDSTFSGGNTAGGNSDDRGIGDFKYPVPSGALALCSANLVPTAPSIVRPQKHFDTLLWTGDDSSDRDITGLEFKPDMVWIKNRSQSDFHCIQDSVRGANKILYANDTDNEQTDNANGHVNSFLPDGFNVDAGGSGLVNENSENYVAWCWKAGGAAVSNSDGSITSSISANQTAGFSIVTWTGTGSAGTIGHGLGDTPKIVIVKRRSGGDNWQVYWIGAGTERSGFLSLTNAFSNGANTSYWGTSEPTSTVFSVGSSATQTNASGETYVAYCWSEIPGYSKFGEYRGNGNSKGKYVNCGFKPAFLIIKRINNSRNWMIFDNKRDPDNPVQTFLEADQSSSDATLNGGVLFLANGFRCITADTDVNANDTSGGDTYIYMAYAEQPGTTSFNTFPNAR